MKVLRGTIQSGRREAAAFTSIPWVAEELTKITGESPYPGTLNLVLSEAAARETWGEIRGGGRGVTLHPQEEGFCAATCFPVLIAGEVTGAVVLPEVQDYPDDVVEVVAAVNLRDRLGLRDGDICELRFHGTAGPRFECVLFDLEGTVVDFQWKLEEAEDELRRTLGDMGFETAPFLREDYAEIRRRALEGAETLSRREEILRRLAPVYDRYDLDALSRWSLRPGARQLFGRLRGAGVKLGLVTNIGRRAVQGALRKFELAGVFGAVVTRDDVVRMKPEGEGIARALGALGKHPASALMVGDSLSDLRAARHAGVPIALIEGGETAIRGLKEETPDFTLAALEETGRLVLGDAPTDVVRR